MRLRFLVIIAGLVAPGLLGALTPHQVLAAPAIQPLLKVVVSPSEAAPERVYYYRGRYYRYRYGGGYYAHRYYRGGRWRYY
jgi:hypothetical protein